MPKYQTNLSIEFSLLAIVTLAAGCAGEPSLSSDGANMGSEDIDVASSALTTPTDPNFSLQWSMNNQAQTVPTEDMSGDIVNVKAVKGVDVNARAAWDISQGTDSVLVGIIEQGDTDITHQDLAANILPCTDSSGCDFVNRDGMNLPSNHATHIAGIIAAVSGNSKGISGLAPKVKLVPMVANANDPTSFVEAINYAKGKGVKVINVSQGGADYDNDTVRTAIANSGILFVCSAGNNATVKYNYPSSYPLSNVIAVANVDPTGEVAPKSNYGEAHVHIGAPGKGIYSTLAGNGYGYMDGTSMAAPHVVAVAALLWSKYPTLTVDDVRNRLFRTGMRMKSLSGVAQSGAMVDAFAALKDVGPVAPTATALATAITLTWPAVAGATKYEVEKDGSVVSAGTALMYTHSGLTAGTGHVYRVRATVSGTVGEWSYRVFRKAVVEPTEETYVLESAHPYTNNLSQSFTISKRNAKQLRAHFSKLELAPDDQLQYSLATGDDTYLTENYSSGFWTHWTNGLFSFYFDSDGANTAYGFKVDKIEYVTGVPNQPESPYRFDVASGKITVGFSCTAGSVTSNLWRATSSGGTYSKIVGVDASAWSYDDTAVTKGKTYYYKLSCSNDLGESAKSNYVGIVAP
ncbi:MAG: S8 family serine peptidase [Polyangiaceae bacterium]